MATQRSTYIPYTPSAPPAANTPKDLCRATWEELYRIATSLVDFDRPVSCSIVGTEQLTAGAAPVYARLLDNSPTETWQMPGGTFDPLTGIYTSSQEGLYQIYVRMTVPPLPSPQTKSYNGQLLLTVKFTNGNPDQTFLLEASALDDQYLTVQGIALIPLNRGDRLYLDGRLIRAAGTATASVTSTLQVIRISGLR